MDYQIRVYVNESIIDYQLAGHSRFSVGSDQSDDCRIRSAVVLPQHVEFYKSGELWMVRSSSSELIPEPRQICEGDIFVLDKEEQIAVYVFGKDIEAAQEFDMAGCTKVMIGRAAQCDMVLPGSNVSRMHAILEKVDDVWQIKDNNSLNGVFVNDEKILEPRSLKDGDIITIGDHNIHFRDERLMIGAIDDDQDKQKFVYPYWFRIAPRLKRELPTEGISIQNPPMETTKAEQDWISMLTSPLVMLLSLGLMAVLTASTSITMLLFTGPMAAAQIILAIRNSRKQKKRYAEKEKNRVSKYTDYLNEIEARIQSQKREQIVAMQQNDPSPEECAEIIRQRSETLWNRRMCDDDFLILRLGVGDALASFEVKNQLSDFTLEDDDFITRVKKITDEAQEVQNVPVTCDVYKNRIVGIVGNRENVLKSVKNLIMETAVHHSYEEVKIVTVYTKRESKEFSWLRWLPHVFSEDRTIRFIASSVQTTNSMMRMFEDVLKDREMEAKDNIAFSPFYLFVLTEREYMDQQIVMKYLLETKKDLGIGVIFAYDDMRYLPKECNTIIDVSESEGKAYNKDNIDNFKKFRMDDFGDDNYEQLSRRMAPIRLKGGAEENAFPTSITFMEGYGVSVPEDFAVERRWKSGKTNESMAVPIGIKANGEPFMFDIHEKKYGPHGMVAGMTGSGKSEMVQTWILSMALRFSPEDVSFVLIDFKGTGLILPFAKLPHLAGTISDLDTKIQRNLIALENELSRRKALLDEYGVNNINNYLKLYHSGKTNQSMPYLFVIIDEFAEFKVQFPDFMVVVDRIFAIGRTLGVFAILLTQKPTGVVDDKMRANTRFRWCLKVASSADSKEMLGHADAAKITVPGRAYVQVGEDEVYELIQSYYSGAPYRPDVQDKSTVDKKVYVVDEQGRRTCYENEEVDRAMASEDSEISKIVDYIADFVDRSTYSVADKIWMPKLPGEIFLENIPGGSSYQDGSWGEEKTEGLSAVCGMVDDPGNQSQYPLGLDFTRDGHIAIFGAPGTGKTTLLQSIIFSLILNYTPEQVNIYLMDFGSWSLGIFKDFPHVGGIANDNDEIKIEKLVQMINKKLADRKIKFSEIGVGSLQAYMEATGEKLPYIVLALDNFAPVLQLYPDIEGFFTHITREGASYGIYFITTVNSTMALGFRINQNIKMAVALQMTDRADYQTIVGKTGGLEPENMDGRGLIKGNPPLEFQAALPGIGASEGERIAYIRQYAARMRKAWEGEYASPIPIMPDEIPFGSIHGKGILLGLSSQYIEPLSLPEQKTHFLPVVGTGGSGKSNMLSLIAEQILLQDETAKIVCFSDSMRGAWSEEARCRIIYAADKFDEYMEELIPVLQKRRDEYAKDRSMTFEPVYVFIDNYRQVFDAISEITATRLASIVKIGKGLNVNLIISEHVDTFCRLCAQGESVCALMARENTGILLGGNYNSYSVFNSNLTPSERARALSEYEGYLLVKGKVTRFKAMKA